MYEEHSTGMQNFTCTILVTSEDFLCLSYNDKINLWLLSFNLLCPFLKKKKKKCKIGEKQFYVKCKAILLQSLI